MRSKIFTITLLCLTSLVAAVPLDADVLPRDAAVHEYHVADRRVTLMEARREDTNLRETDGRRDLSGREDSDLKETDGRKRREDSDLKETDGRKRRDDTDLKETDGRKREVSDSSEVDGLRDPPTNLRQTDGRRDLSGRREDTNLRQTDGRRDIPVA